MASHHTGLSAAEVAERVRRGQTNDFEARSGRSYLQIALDNVFNLFNIVLFTLLLIVLLARDYATVFFAGFSVLTNSLLGMYQEIQAKRKLDQMAALAAKEVRVWRDGQLVTLNHKQVVLDDLIAIEPGDRIVVDGVMIQSDALEVDESQLTGESDAVFKSENDPVSSGSFCIAGSGVMKATRVGADSTINKLSVIAKAYKNILTPTQHKINAIVEISVLGMFILTPMLFLAGVVRGEAPLDIIRNAVVFVTSLVPQGLVLVATLSLTIGAVRISQFKTLIQRVNAVESMANVSVLCFDKTGTLTENRLAVTEITPIGAHAPNDIHARLRHYTDSLSHQNRTAGAVNLYVKDAPAPSTPKQREIPFTSGRKWGAVQFTDGSVLALGAPERIVTDPDLLQRTRDMSAHGLRVLAFAQATALPEGDKLIGTADLDIGLKVISGDNLETVRAIAGESGMSTDYAYTGDQLEDMPEGEFDSAVRKGSVFARIEPATKQRIVESLRRQGEYVAMVGDGVNDVPALKAANLAVVMNDGTQISKDVADIVLLNNAMSTLPKAFYEGREITQTIFGTTKMFMARNLYNVLLFVFIGFMMLPFPITPVQMSWASFGTVNMPATLIAFGVIRPKFIKDFRRDVLDYILTIGLVGAVVLAILFTASYFLTGGNLMETRSVLTLYICLFGMLIVWQVQGVDIAEPRTFLQHRRVVFISAIVTALTMASFYTGLEAFRFSGPSLHDEAGRAIIVMLTAMFCLTIIITSRAMRDRTLINRLWMLVGVRDAQEGK
ncbi:MAG: HAD-IC family P-type ATPase [Anaerolineae bacterium]|nr:HAD-IC family P-type ATPase [Anaerolineae bacterium]